MLAASEFAKYLPLAIAVAIVAVCGVFWGFVWPWIHARFLGVPVSFGQLAAMRLRGSPVGKIARAYGRAQREGLDLDLNEIETHHLAGGRPERLVDALVVARRHDVPLSEDCACALDILGHDIPALVEKAIHPTTYTWPSPEEDPPYIRATARDGAEVHARLKVVTRIDFDRYIGGAPAETVLLRMGDALIKTIAATEDSWTLTSDPEGLAVMLKDAGLDEGAAVEVVDIYFEFLEAGSQ